MNRAILPASENFVKEFLRECSKPKFDLKKEILTPPFSKRYRLVGSAFDYLLRFYIERMNSPECTVVYPWVAEGWTIAGGRVDVWLGYDPVGKKSEWVVSPGGIGEKCEQILSKAKAQYSLYLRTGEITDDLIKSSIKLSQLDNIAKSCYVDERLGTVTKDDVRDLRQLMAIVDPAMFRARQLCVLNPRLGNMRGHIGCADLVIDDALLEIKTVKHLQLEKKYLDELISYYVLFRMGGFSQMKGVKGALVEPKIRKLGIYYSRYAELFTLPVEAVVNERKLALFLRRLAKNWKNAKVLSRTAMKLAAS